MAGGQAIGFDGLFHASDLVADRLQQRRIVVERDQEDSSGAVAALIAFVGWQAERPGEHGSGHAPGTVGLIGYALFEIFLDERCKALQQRVEQGFLRGEMIKQAAFRHAGGLGGGIERKPGDSPGAHESFGGVEDARSGVGRWLNHG